jgi:ribosomal protein S8E
MRFAGKRTLFAGAVALMLALGAGVAVGAVTLYSNDFSRRGDFEDIVRSGGGKRCDKKYREKSEVMVASVEVSPATCSFRTPVQGDDELPNYTVAVEGKVIKKTPKSLRAGTFLEISARAGGGDTGYKLQVFPRKRRFELEREPQGNGFPERGKSDAIKGINERISLRLAVEGARVTAFVNGKEVAMVTDNNTGQVQGRKIRFAIGSQKESRKDVVGTFKRISVSVPEP